MMLRSFSSHVTNTIKTSRALFSTKALSVVFFGSDAISNPTLQLLYSDYLREDGLLTNLEVVCTSDKKDKHSNETIASPVRTFCERNNIACTVIPQMEHHSLKGWHPPTSIESKQFDLAVVASFGFFIPPHVISCFKNGGINMHPSLLPKYRGPAPIQHAILNGEKETGVSIITLNDKVIDSGKILYQKSISINDKAHYPELASTLAFEGAVAVMDTLYNLRSITPTEQSVSLVTNAPKITKDMSFVNLDLLSAKEVFDLYRALNYQFPLRCMWNDTLVFLRSIRPIDKPSVSDKFLPMASQYAPGSVLYCKKMKSLIVKCKDNWVYCDEIQLMPKSKSVDAAVIGNDFIDEKQKFTLFKGYN